jgi:acyl-CoA thioesterase
MGKLGIDLDELLEALRSGFREEPYASLFGIELLEIEPGRALVRMQPSEDLRNLFGAMHGGAIFSLIDAAFEAAANSHGTVAVALNVGVNYINPASFEDALFAEAREVSRSRRISTYHIQARDEKGIIIATSQATAYRKNEPLPFL